MATLLRSRRFADRALEATHQFVIFPLRQHWYALPIQALQRVSQLPTSEAPLQDSEAGQWVDVSLIEIESWMDSSGEDTLPSEPPPQDACLILFKGGTGQTFGLRIDAQPAMQRIAQRQIIPLADLETYPPALAAICSAVIQSEGSAPIFLLDLEQLCAPMVHA